VHEAINAWLEFNEHAKVCEVANCALVDRTDWVLGHQVVPWIWLELLHAKCKLALALIDVQNNSVDHLAERHHL